MPTKQVVTTVTRSMNNSLRPMRRLRRRRAAKSRAAGNQNNVYLNNRSIRNAPMPAPVASGLTGRRTRQSGVYAPTVMQTSDLLQTVQLGTTPLSVVYTKMLGPQELPPEARGRLMSRLFAKYRVRDATIRIESAVPTSAGGQYAAFFDPNPVNDWEQRDAVGALTSMPVQDTAAAWECLKLVIPRSQLERNQVLWTEDLTGENLVTRFGQVVILNLATSNVSPPGEAEVTVWLDATWEFYEPNASSEAALIPVDIPVGNWDIATSTYVSYPTPTLGTITSKTVYKAYPELPGTLVSSGTATPWLAVSNNLSQMMAFASEDEAIAFARDNVFGTQLGPGATHPQSLPATVLLKVHRYSGSKSH